MDWRLRRVLCALACGCGMFALNARGDDAALPELRGTQLREGDLQFPLDAYSVVLHPSAEHEHPAPPAPDGHSHADGMALGENLDGHSHGGELAECHDHDWLEEYQHNHDTLDGFPRIHLLRIEHAWLDPHWQLKYTGASGRDLGTLDEHEFELEYFHVFNNRFAAVMSVPYSFLNPDVGHNRNGFGDLSFGVQWLAYNGDYAQMSAALTISTPTGDSENGFGEGFATLEPTLLGYFDLGCGNGIQTQFSIKSPLSVREPEDEFSYNLGYSHTFAGTKDCRYFRWFTPLIELNGSTLLNGAEYGRTVVNLTPGVRWFIGEENQFGVGMSFPITGDRDEQYQVIVSYIAHF